MQQEANFAQSRFQGFEAAHQSRNQAGGQVRRRLRARADEDAKEEEIANRRRMQRFGIVMIPWP